MTDREPGIYMREIRIYQRQADRQRQRNRQTETETERQTNRQKETERDRDGLGDRETEKEVSHGQTEIVLFEREVGEGERDID